MERLFEALERVTFNGTLVAPRGAALFCIVVAALYMTSVHRAQRLYDEAADNYAIYPSMSHGVYAVHADLFEKRARTFREYMLRVSTFCLWLAGAMSLFAAQAYVEAVRFDPDVYGALYSHWMESGMRTTWPGNAAPAQPVPDTLDYLNVFYMFTCLAAILALAWLLVPAVFTKSDYTLRERTGIWLRELLGKDPWANIPVEDSQEADTGRVTRIGYRRTS